MSTAARPGALASDRGRTGPVWRSSLSRGASDVPSAGASEAVGDGPGNKGVFGTPGRRAGETSGRKQGSRGLGRGLGPRELGGAGDSGPRRRLFRRGA